MFIIIFIILLIIITAIFLFMFFRTKNSANINQIIEDPNLMGELKKRIRTILLEYCSIKLIKYPNFTISGKSSTSYTTGKKYIHLCMFNGQKNEYFDLNTLMHVLIHEVSHVLCSEWDINKHGEEFISINTELKEIGTKLKVFDDHKNVEEIYYHVCTTQEKVGGD